ncbi:esterase [Massilia sp. CF038]|uniref:esterase n=1 Tax=Massilia sp. CF038 TaxID=1881045 RepID=UPI00091472A1|nr:esterase [Massilia sp. CF038]SHG41258.1 hypothetical protein SAMN05428948_0347 [Massilia sp. CF038]
MKKLLWAAIAAMLPHGVMAAEPALYLRGGFNGWGIDNALVDKGNGIYETRLQLAPGNHPFKVGSKDWATEWVLHPDHSVSVAPDTGYPMAKKPGPEDYLFVKKSADYTFQLDLSAPAAPVLRVMRIETAPLAQRNPHQGNRHIDERSFPTYDGKRETARFSSPAPRAALRSYVHSTTAQLRDPGPQYVRYSESAGVPVVRSGSLAFDALFALAGAEMKKNAVRRISDGNYNAGAPVDCDCFETGEKWHYVWTRDLSYAADLGLAMLDPKRVRNSLEFKLSAFRSGVSKAAAVPGRADGLQIIQDTGSGGSWPVSTDRITWAFGAEKVLGMLTGAERRDFAARALAALSNTIEIDRVAAFDAVSGLYTGEQSFLDWRDQSYAAWIVNDLASMASAKALSTNVGHYKALSLAAALAREHGDQTLGAKYDSWAGSLKTAINQKLWLADAGMYSSLSAAHFDGAPMYKFDWLGQALAIVTGVADADHARSILAHYPHGPMGAPVIYPQQQDLPVYHNRAMWPFVTAYGLKAAVIGRNVSVADAAYATLIRGAALNLSNMENLEWLSGQSLLLDENHPALIGPVINSRRQLWSVGAYLGMVIENIFGIGANADGIRIQPFITAKLQREHFGHARTITLRGLHLQDKHVNVRIHLPAPSKQDGYFAPSSIRVNGKAVQSSVRWAQLPDTSVIDIVLGPLQAGVQEMQRVSADPYVESAAVFAPRESAIASLTRVAGGKVELAIRPAKESENTVYNIYRDGKLAASRIAASTWVDVEAGPASCYAVEAQFLSSGNRSHHSVPACVAPGLDVSAPSAQWGAPGDVFRVDAIDVTAAGHYQAQVRYRNGANQINLGISGGVKWMALQDASGHTVAQGVVQLPHTRVEQGKPIEAYSTPLAAQLAPGRYRLLLSDFYNMSYLEANRSFSAAGGADGPVNRVDIEGVRLLPTTAP